MTVKVAMKELCNYIHKHRPSRIFTIQLMPNFFSQIVHSKAEELSETGSWLSTAAISTFLDFFNLRWMTFCLWDKSTNLN